jgi:adenine-specific DNA-methyltransferase
MRYYGNKTKLLKFIDDTASNFDVSDEKVFFDMFTGTTSVAKHFKELGYKVIANDWLFFSYALASTNIEINHQPSFSKLIKKMNLSSSDCVIDYLNNSAPRIDFITKNYTPYESNIRQYFTIENGQKIDSIRIQINDWLSNGLITNLESNYLITSLIYAINIVSNVSGTYGSFLKKWDNRSFKKLTLIAPKIINSNKSNLALNEDALKIIDKYDVDILYLDPPYNSRQYASNYFLLELIAEGWFGESLPEIYGYTGMRPYNHQKSFFSSKREAYEALKKLINKAKAKYIMLSYNNEGIITPEEIIKILSSRGTVKIYSNNHKRYRSTGQDGTNNKTTEYLYVLETKRN